MTSANISNLFVQVAPNVSVDSQNSTAEVKSDFTNLMASKVNAAPENEIVPAETQSFSKVDSSSVSTEAKRSQIKESTKAEDNKVAVDVEKTSKAVEKLDKEVKDVIADELNVTTEDVEKAMEVLGFTVLDLVDKNNLATLIATVTGVDNNVSVLLNDSFSTLSDKIFDLTNNMLEELSMTLEEVQSVLGEMENVGDFENAFNVAFENGPQTNADDAVVSGLEDEESFDETIASEVNATSDNSKVVGDDNKEDYDKADDQVVKTEVKMPEKSETLENKNESFFNSNDRKSSERKEGFTKEDNFSAISNNEKNTFFDSVSDVVEVPSGETVTTQEIIDQIVEQTKVVNTSENTTLEMILNPEGLGKVYLEITQEKGGEITAKFVTTNEAVKEALENQMATLRNDLNTTTSKVTSVEVSVATHEFEQNLEQGANRQDEESARRNAENNSKRRTSINLNNLDELTGLMTEEEQLVAQIMKDNGNSVNYEV